MKKPTCKIYDNGNKEWFLEGKMHREDGPAAMYVTHPVASYWWLNDICVDPETVVDLWLSRGTYCRYDEETNTLRFT